MSERRVFITGVGTVTPFGIGVKTFEENLVAGTSAVSPIKSFDTVGLPTTFAAQVPFANEELETRLSEPKAAKTMNRAARFESIAAVEAVQAAGLQLNDLDPNRVGVSMGAGGLGLMDQEYLDLNRSVILEAAEGTNSAESARMWDATCRRINPITPLKALPNIPTAHLAIQFNVRGPCQTLSTACISGTQAVGEAYRLIKHCYADVMIAGAGDAMVNSNGLMGFSTLGVLSKNNTEWQTAARPFDRRRDGFVLGEGSAVFILESEEIVKSRDAEPLAEVVGYANTCDAYRLTDQPPEAWGSIRAMQQALSDAKVNPSQIEYINAHGTGTQMNDRTETRAIKAVFGSAAAGIPISSTKSMIGHLIAAAGAVELAACVLMLKRQMVHPTINYEQPDPDCDLDYVPNHARETKLRHILTNSFGFGGQNACLIIKRV
jgi:3-oxoacyl-[acyl-carrier-protein] synthase II